MTDLATTSPVETGELPADVSAAVDGDGTPVETIVVRLGRGRFATDLASVAEVGRVPAVTRIPGVPAWLAGVANWRGRILPILDLRSLLGAVATEPNRSSRLLVLTDRGTLVGVLVDAVEGTMTLDADIAAVPTGVPAEAAALLRGQLAHDDGPVAVLDVDAVMRLRDRLPRGRRSA
ncbi:MAG TPA: chemotaxis protein CheW [Mycobacteriales bacterium]|nr:chemotaxis protein CheW [Mycobacteriales bacterium]